ncbi:MAG TPA: 3-deoxy-7-phosphoheptulonate synthase [Candidatus Sumerlaeota bacterium]|nr:3-deoxy-7-phosphoheptulonate synthase [Candidatus Sumerlaeota bacterium]HOR28383.1 3-deoxy-7-phosphoheptulonate synthase [Candidatus Sumerlaeota bacterium]HPK03219.1 3-deoxy-7-phosphoheptulonate synthase [Candidatus Sumerlaeota bacterium]
MIIVMKPHSPARQIDDVIHRIEELGYRAHPIYGVERTVIGCVGREDKSPLSQLESMPGVEAAIPILKPYKLASREFRPEPSVLDVAGVAVGGERLAIVAGPCSVESRAQTLEIAHAVREAGAQFLRGGAFKPRTSPYAFQGLGAEGLEILAEAREQTGLKLVTEVVGVEDLPAMVDVVDVFQIGARNCQNYPLLNAVGQTRKPVVLKRGMATLIREWLMAAEYILAHGNYNVILCERGIRTFETATRFTLDLNAVPVLKETTHLPVLVDPSHGTGQWQFVEPMARAAIAAGADGLMIEVHQDPPNAASDGAQSLKPEKFARLIAETRKIALAMGRQI